MAVKRLATEILSMTLSDSSPFTMHNGSLCDYVIHVALIAWLGVANY